MLAGMSVVLNAVDPVFMIDGKTAPDTDEQDEDYEEKPEGAAPATGRLSRVSPNALQAISGSEERTEDEPPDHAYYHESSTCPGRISSGNSDNSAQLVQAD